MYVKPPTNLSNSDFHSHLNDTPTQYSRLPSLKSPPTPPSSPNPATLSLALLIQFPSTPPANPCSTTKAN
jgi:hypothetical protein